MGIINLVLRKMCFVEPQIMAVTQKEIALRVGVSQSIVGRILNGGGMASEETRARVLEEAQRLGYRFNGAAQSLKRGQTQTISVWVPYLDHSFSMRVLHLWEQHARQADYAIQLSAGGEHGEGARFSSTKPFYGSADGVLMLDAPFELQQKLEAHPATPPAVFVDVFRTRASPRFDVVSVSKSAAARASMEFLLQSGCRRIGFLAGAWAIKGGLNLREERSLAYYSVLREHDLKPFPIGCGTALPHRDVAQKVMLDWLARHGADSLDALFCENDDMAIGAARAFKALGLRVPEDVRLAGCDAIPDAVDAVPSLSTIRLPLDEMSQRAWQMLQQRLAQSDLAPRLETLQAQFVRRETNGVPGFRASRVALEV